MTQTGQGTTPGTQSNPGTDAGAGASPGGADQNATIASLQAENERLSKSHREMQQLMGRHSQELHRLRQLEADVQRRGTSDAFSGTVDDDGYLVAPQQSHPNQGVDPGSLPNPERDRVDVIQYRQENPDWADYAEEIDKLLESPEAAQVAVFRGPRVPDYYRTLTNARRYVRLRQYETGSRKSEVESQTQPNANANVSPGVISGNAGGAPAPKQLDANQFRGMSSKQMLETGALRVSEADPPLPR